MTSKPPLSFRFKQYVPETSAPFLRAVRLTGACGDQSGASLPTAHRGGHLDLIGRAPLQVVDGVGGRSGGDHMGLLIPPYGRKHPSTLTSCNYPQRV